MRQMKDSGIEWIGDIPSEWEIKTAFQLFTQVKNKNEGLPEKNLLSLSYGKIKRKSIDTNGGLLPESFDNYNIIEKNDIVLRLTDLQNDHTSLRVGISNERGIVTSAYVTLRNRANNIPLYLYYYLHSFDIAKGFYGMGAGVRQGLNWDGLKKLKIVIPPVDEQEKIIDFLDHTCAEIDTVIEKTKATIEEYKKLKQSVITEAVTKGVRGDRTMKDSGIEWIGAFPEEWTFAELKMFCTVNNGKEISNEVDKDTEGAVAVYGSGGAFKYTDKYMFDGTTVMFGRKGTLGKPLYVTGKVWVVDTMYYLAYSTKLIPKFNYYQLWAFDWQPHITQTALPSVVASQIVACKFAIPDLQEQEEIINYLDSKCAEMDKLIANKTHLLEEMESYKKSVIYEYVTGKKEV